ncbi:MAG: IS91 family transposase, partial [Sulfitobacter sp.]|nr:IS91 family transposase [Sulfitobacter sp.]
FLLHVLPPGFHRIRHYGLLANAARVENLARARQLLAAPISPLIAVPLAPAEAVAQDTPAENARPCPCCGGPMVIIETFARGHPPRAPPAAMGEAA